MNKQKTIVLLLRSGGDFSMNDVALITYHILTKWESPIPPRILCLWDKATHAYDLGTFQVLPYSSNGTYGTWDRIQLYGPEMEQYKPFLYLDLDTAIIQSVEKIFDLVKDPDQFITLEDFWMKGALATGVVWFPANNEKTRSVWVNFKKPNGSRMDKYIRTICDADMYWQHLTKDIIDFKPRTRLFLEKVPEHAVLVCFHGKPRIPMATHIPWVREYVDQATKQAFTGNNKVTVIIPYNKDRGWLKDAINSIPKDTPYILSKGNGIWSDNFNKALSQVNTKYVRWLHEDDMLTENSIEDSVKAMEAQGVDILQGNAIEISGDGKILRTYVPKVKNPTIKDLLENNMFHAAAMVYKTDVFQRVGLMNGSKEMYGHEELEFNLRCLKKGMVVGYVDKPLGIYRRHPNQIIRTIDKREKAEKRKQLIEKYS